MFFPAQKKKSEKQICKKGKYFLFQTFFPQTLKSQKFWEKKQKKIWLLSKVLTISEQFWFVSKYSEPFKNSDFS